MQHSYGVAVINFTQIFVNMKEQILVVSGTNRKGSRTKQVAQHYANVLTSLGHEPTFYALEDLSDTFLVNDLYGQRTPEFEEVVVSKIEPATKYVFVMPEYNGSFPGVLKLFIDAVPPASFHGKKAGLIGVSAGHLGCVRGMDDFTNILNYIQVSVLFHKPKLSGIERLFNEEGVLTDERALVGLQRHAEGMISF